MSYDIGWQAMTLGLTGRCAHTEYCSNYALVRAVTGLDPREDGTAWDRFMDAWDVDFIWSVDDGPTDWFKVGRATDMGHAEFLEGGVDRRDTVTCPFPDVEDVFAFDASEEYGMIEVDELAAYYTERWERGQAAHPNQVLPCGYYKSIVSGAIQAFGWDMLLTAAHDRKRFERVLDGFFRLTMNHVEAWARTPAKVFLQHDDMVWTAGPFMHPDFYRSVIFPYYRKMWQRLHEAGKIVLFCSDGNFTPFVDDLVDAGADGLIFEPLTDLETIVRKYGKSKVIMGSLLDCRTLTFGDRDGIRAEIDATLELTRDCPGFVFAVGNHIPSNVPVDNALYFIDYLREHWDR